MYEQFNSGFVNEAMIIADSKLNIACLIMWCLNFFYPVIWCKAPAV